MCTKPIPPKYFFTTVDNPWSIRALWSIIDQKKFDINEHFRILSPKRKQYPRELIIGAHEIIQNGVFIFDHPISNEENLFFCCHCKDAFPDVLGVKPMWAVEILPKALGNIEKVAMEIAGTFQGENIEKMWEYDCYPWGKQRRRLIA
jgi:hypothetical protein